MFTCSYCGETKHENYEILYGAKLCESCYKACLDECQICGYKFYTEEEKAVSQQGFVICLTCLKKGK